MAGIVIGEPVSNPLRACDRYQAAWLFLKADLGNSPLTAAIISSLVATLFAAIVSMTTCLIVRFGSVSGFSAFCVFGAARATLFSFDCFFTFVSCFLFFMLFIVALQNEWKGLIAASLLVQIVSGLVTNAQKKTSILVKYNAGVPEAAY